ncbi:NUDIX hydrolase [Deinococcus depolymerans]|uniref:NUDIX domain-containing protein n=1 Tax=Deinococcus depolymerans TaxID=392408 RepID=A0ABN1BL26_9DEIO
MVTFYPTQPAARADAAVRGLREKVVCFVVRGEASPELLVFDHVPDDSGVQLPAGGVEPGETPEQAAVRELREESGLNLTGPEFLTSYLWEAHLPTRFTRQVCHAFLLRAPHDLPHTWACDADGERFAFRWAPLPAPALDWEMDAALPWACAALRPAPSCATPDSAESVILPN